MDEPQESHCKINDTTERCIINPDASAVQDDPACYKTDKGRCAVKKNKIIKLKPKTKPAVAQQEPVAIEEQPKFQMLIDPDSRFKNNIEIGGLLLCKCPSEFMEQRDDHFTKFTKAQAEAVDNSLMRQSDPRMPLFRENKSSTSFGKGV